MRFWGRATRGIFFSSSTVDLELLSDLSATCRVNNLRSLGTIQAIFVGKEIFDSPSVKKNNFDISDRIKPIYTRFKAFRDLVTL